MSRLTCLVAIAATVLTSACTHARYQRVAAGLASGMFVFDGAQTVAAVRKGTPEGNVIITTIFGDHPRQYQTWAIAGGQALLTPLITTIPGTRGNDDMGEWLKDFLLTGLVMVEGFTVWANAQNRGMPLMQSWR